MNLKMAMCLIPIISIGCRVRDDGSRVKDVTPGVVDDTGGLELEIDTKSLKSAKISFSQSAAKLDLWSMLHDADVTKKMQARIGTLKIDQNNQIPAADHGTKPSSTKVDLSNRDFSFSGVPGRTANKKIALRERGGVSMAFSRELAGDFFSECPSEYFEPNGKFTDTLKKSSNGKNFSIESEGSLSIIKVVYRPRGITWLLNCERIVGWPDITESKLMVKLSFEVRLDADRIIFPGVSSDPKYPGLKVNAVATEREGYGTRYFRDYTSIQPETSYIQRWNPLRSRIVIDDINDSFGKPLSQFKQGPWVQEALKIAAADLRIKFPALGKKIVLKSEQPLLQPDIAFAMGDAMGAAGIALMLLDDKNGELRQARIGLGEESNLTGRIKMIEGFHKLGLIEDPRRSFKDSYLFTVLHELGHTLGLRHNFEGYGLNRNWGNDLQAVMSYAMIGFPIEFVSDKIEWKPHDVLSLKILYAEMSGGAAEIRAPLISEVLKFPLSQDEFFSENPFGGLSEHIQRSLKFLEDTNHPKFAKFRESTPDWKSKLKGIYKEAYDVDLDQ